MGKSWENHGKIMGKSMKIGNILERSEIWDSQTIESEKPSEMETND